MPTSEEIQHWQNDPNNWKWGIFYFNKRDQRIFVDKRIAWTGITLNFANPKSYVVIVVATSFFWFIISMIEKNTN